MKTYNKSDFHNPEQLTRQQVGTEYRLLLPGERHDDQNFCVDDEIWTVAGYPNGAESLTYRVPLATPLPDGTVLSSNECCFSDDVYAELRAAHAAGKTIQARCFDGKWRDFGNDPSWTFKPERYRVKPDFYDGRPKIYVAGPMSSFPDTFNFPAFFKAHDELEKQGYEAINPAGLDIAAGYTLEKLKQLSPAEFQEFLKGAVKRDLDAIQTCQAIAMLPGWESSKGAKAELAVAQWLGLDEVYLEDAKTPYDSDERAEWSNDCGKIDMGDYSSAAAAQYADDDPKGAAGAKKAPMQLLPPDALLETARAMGHGAAKYVAWNFINTTVCASTYIGAIGRHWAAWAKGEDRDRDSGLSHLSHLAANCFILMTAAQQGTLNDDRPKLK